MLDMYQITTRLIVAAFLSGIIGYEREVHGRAAGLRTTILVGVGSCLVMITSMHLFDIYRGIAVVDPTRIAAQVVSGIGFLGAGTILRFHASVRGLTTAAGLWAVSGIGLAVGSGFYAAALPATAIIFLVLVMLSRLEKRIKRKIDRTLRIEFDGAIDQFCQITEIISELEIEIQNIEISSLQDKKAFALLVNLKLVGEKLSNKITDSIVKIKGVTMVKWD